MKTKTTKTIASLLVLLITTTAFSACAKTPSQDVDSNAQDATAVYEAKIEYYESLISELQTQLLNEKEENFIEVCEYRLQIDELENSIKALSDKLDAISVNQKPSPEPSRFETQSKEIESANPYIYTITNNQVTITAYVGEDSQVTVPTLIEGFPVVSIGERAFSGSNVTKVNLPDGITHIDWFAFSDCKTLTEIAIPSSVESIGYGSFDRCPSSLTVICKKGSYAESYATSWGITVKAN